MCASMMMMSASANKGSSASTSGDHISDQPPGSSCKIEGGVQGVGYGVNVETYLMCARQAYTKYYYDTLVQAGNSHETALVQATAAVEKLVEGGYFLQLRALFFQHQQNAISIAASSGIRNEIPCGLNSTVCTTSEAVSASNTFRAVDLDSSSTLEPHRSSDKSEDSNSCKKPGTGLVSFKLKLNSTRWKSTENQHAKSVSVVHVASGNNATSSMSHNSADSTSNMSNTQLAASSGLVNCDSRYIGTANSIYDCSSQRFDSSISRGSVNSIPQQRQQAYLNFISMSNDNSLHCVATTSNDSGFMSFSSSCSNENNNDLNIYGTSNRVAFGMSCMNSGGWGSTGTNRGRGGGLAGKFNAMRPPPPPPGPPPASVHNPNKRNACSAASTNCSNTMQGGDINNNLYSNVFNINNNANSNNNSTCYLNNCVELNNASNVDKFVTTGHSNSDNDCFGKLYANYSDMNFQIYNNKWDSGTGCEPLIVGISSPYGKNCSSQKNSQSIEKGLAFGKCRRNRFDITGKDLENKVDHINELVQSNENDGSVNKKLEDNDLKSFSMWIKRVYDELEHLHSSLAWRRTLNTYTNNIVVQYRSGKFVGKDWTETPVPREEDILTEVGQVTCGNKDFSEEKFKNDDSSMGDSCIEEKGNKEDDNSFRSNKIVLREADPSRKTNNEKLRNYTNNQRKGKKNQVYGKNQDNNNISDDDFIPLNNNGNNNNNENNNWKLGKRNNSKKKFDNSGILKMKKNKVENSSMKVDEDVSRREYRAQRFSQNFTNLSISDDCNASSNAQDGLTSNGSSAPLTWQEKLAYAKNTERIVGTSRAYEKQFLRLCGPPDPSTIRPEEILKESFKMILEKYSKDKKWRYIEEQFRSIRQDLTVQGIKNSFTIQVYEANARLALENGDLGQFNQCQTQLKELYKTLDSSLLQNASEMEFLCYRLLYLSLQNMRLDLLRSVGELTAEQKKRPEIIFSMQVRRAFSEGNWRRYLRLKRQGPYLSEQLLNIFDCKMRMQALLIMAKTSRQLDPQILVNELCFSSLGECMGFLQAQETVWSSNNLIDCKASAAKYALSPLLQSRKVKAMG